jgi:hypothetical protein
MCEGFFGRNHWAKLGRNLLPTAAVLLESKLQLTMPFEVDERCLSINRMIRITEDV